MPSTMKLEIFPKPVPQTTKNQNKKDVVLIPKQGAIEISNDDENDNNKYTSDSPVQSE